MLNLYISHFALLWFFKVLENFVVDLKKNMFMKAVVNVPSPFSGRVKAFKLDSVFSNVFLIY